MPLRFISTYEAKCHTITYIIRIMYNERITTSKILLTSQKYVGVRVDIVKETPQICTLLFFLSKSTERNFIRFLLKGAILEEGK